MENQITCPNCHKTISNDPIIDAAANKEGLGDRAITCDCGQRITYWAIAAQLREQKTPGKRFRNWLQNLFKARDERLQQ